MMFLLNKMKTLKISADFGLTYRSVVEDFSRGFRRQNAGRVQARWLEEKQEILRKLL